MKLSRYTVIEPNPDQPGTKLDYKEFLQRYRDYCETVGSAPLTFREIKQYLQEKAGCRVTTSKGYNSIYGLRIKNETIENQEEMIQ